MMKSPNIETILQKIKQSTERQRELENEHVKAISRLNNSGTHNFNEEVPTLQSLLRELEKKIELETVHYEELMLELTLTKRHDKEEQKLSREEVPNSSHHLLHTPQSSISSAGKLYQQSFNHGQNASLTSLPSTPVHTVGPAYTTGPQYYNNNLRDDIDEVSAINNINAMLAQATSSIRNENESLLAGLNGTRTEELKRQQMQLLEQGPKFVSDEEIERIKAKIEEDNRAIAALDTKKYDPYVPVPRTTTIPGYGSPSLDSKQTLLSELRSEAGGLSSLTGSASSPYVPSSDYSPLPPIRPQIGMPPTTMYRHNVHTSQSISGGLGSMMDQPPYYSLASPPFEGQISGSHVQHNDPLENSNLCDILMLERALENEAHVSHAHGHSENKVDMLELPGKGRCFVYLARYTYDPYSQSQNENPEHELPLYAGDYVLVWGDPDEDGFVEGELLDGRRGLVPSNYITKLVGEDLMEFHQSMVLTGNGTDGVADDGWSTSIPQDLPTGLRDMPSSNAMTPEPHLNTLENSCWDEHEHLMNPMFLQSPDEIDLPPLDPELLDHQRRRQQDEDQVEASDQGAVPPPKQLTLERQLNKSILIGWNPPDCPPGIIEMYHVYVDGFLKTTVRASDKTRALVEGVDSAKPHRISVRSVTINRRTSRDAACTMIIGKDAPLGPSCVKATNITSSSAIISWLPSNSNFQHTVSVNGVEVRAVKPGVYRHTITGLTPNTTYRVSIRAKNIKASPYVDEKSLIRLLEKLSAHTEFRTLTKGLPDPPMDVRVDSGPQDGTILVTWIPVTLNVTSTGNKIKTSPITGYAVFADGKRVTDVDSPSSDHALVDLACIGHFNPKNITVRSKSRDLLSADSTSVPVPASSRRRNKMEGGRGRLANGYRMGGRGARRGARRDISGQMVIDHDEDNLSDKETYSKNIPAIASEVDMYSDEEIDRTGGRFGRGGRRSGSLARHRRGYNSRDRGQSRIFVALFDYDPPTMSPNPEACEEELPFREGQLIKIIGEKDADGFYWGECGGLSGYVPCNMVSEVQVDDERVARELLKDDQRNRGRGIQRDRWGDIYANTPTKKMIALYDYDPMELSPNVDMEVELSFRTGDIITVFGEMDDDGFYMAELRGQRGLVPSNFLTEAPGQYTGQVQMGGGVPGRPGQPMIPGQAPQQGGRTTFMQNGTMMQPGMPGQQMVAGQQQQVPVAAPAKTGLMGGLFGGMSKITSAVGGAATTAPATQPNMQQPMMSNMGMGMQQQNMQQPMQNMQQQNMQQQNMQQPMQQQNMQQPMVQQQQQVAAAPVPVQPAAPPVVNLDNIPGLDDFDPPSAKPAVSGAATSEPSGLLGGITGGLTGGLQAGLGGLTGAAGGVTGKLGDVAGSATGAAGSLLSGGKGLFKKFGF